MTKTTMTTAIAMALLFAGSVTMASAAPVTYVLGNECPPDGSVGSGGSARQYYLTEAVACLYEGDQNMSGDNAEANQFLNAAAAPAIWDGLTDWVGLGKTPAGFSFTKDAGNDDGTFTFGAPLTGLFNQFAVGIKDGGSPKWAIFLLPKDAITGNWGFSTNGGELSHFFLYGHTVFNPPPPDDDDDPPPPDDDDPPTVPEPATLAMLGFGLVGVARRFRSKR